MPRRSLTDLYAALLAFLLPLAYSPSVGARFLTPKVALLLTAVPVGVLTLGALVRTQARRPAVAAIAFLAVGLIAALLSGVPTLALFGAYEQYTGLLFMCATVGVWALGRVVSTEGSTLVLRGLGASFVVNAIVAIVQHHADLSVLGLGLQSSRSTGLMGNPVHAGAFFAGAGAMAIAAVSRSRSWFLVLVLAGMATQAAGSRLGIVVLVGAALVELTRRRNLTALAAVACVAVGVLAGQAVVATSTGQSSTSRLASGVAEHSTINRLHTWSSAPAMVADRPLFGWGPGRYAIPSERHKPVELVRSGGDRAFVDAHNIFVEYATTTGLPGLAALVAFLVLAARGASGPMAAFAAGVFALLLVQPLHPATAPLAALALGAAAPRDTMTRWSRPRPLLLTTTSGLALLAGASMLIGDTIVATARLDYEPTEFDRALTFLPAWPELDFEESLMWVFYAESDDNSTLYRRAVAARRDAVGVDPQSARTHHHLGAILFKVGDLPAARASFESALARAPRALAPRLGLARVALADDDPAAARSLAEEAARLNGSISSEMQEILDAVDRMD